MSVYSRLLRAAEERLDEIVQMADACVQEGGKRPEESQLRNLVNLAAETESVAVLDNYIRYQSSRSSPPIPRKFGEQILKDLEKLKQMAREIVQGKVDPESPEGRRLRMHLIRMYLGFLARSAIATEKGRG
ncbi:MAG: hypothetical protein KatS3mg115_2457 [Candidatus Poribacteria bacterium]|nr:MAG: hypothetical protein KatS3mg115_2457 [Candidatus Poribacteria bacterium]